MMNHPFYSNENLQQLQSLCYGFLKDKHKIDLPTGTFVKTVKEVIQTIGDIHGMDVSSINKRIILGVRDKLLAAPPPPNPNPIYEVPEATQKEEPEDEFFKKLQTLELQRKAPVTPPPPLPPVAASTPIQPMTTTPPSLPQQPPQPITVIVPSVSVASHGITTCIHSRNREWIYNADVSTLVWNGPLPKQMDESNFRVVSMMLPRRVLQFSPYVILRIEGAGGQHQDVYMTPLGANASTNTWVSYQPCSESMSYIKRFALPWTLRILDVNEEEMELGKDAWLVEGPMDAREGLTFSHSELKDVRRGFTTGERIIFRDGTGNVRKAWVQRLGLQNKMHMEVEWEHVDGMKGMKEPVYVMNDHRQWTVLFESHQTSHDTKK